MNIVTVQKIALIFVVVVVFVVDVVDDAQPRRRSHFLNITPSRDTKKHSSTPVRVPQAICPRNTQTQEGHALSFRLFFFFFLLSTPHNNRERDAVLDDKFNTVHRCVNISLIG